MDEQLISMLALENATTENPAESFLRYTDPANGVVEVLSHKDDPAPRRYTLKPISELYSPEVPGQSVNVSPDTHMPLLLTIERVFAKAARTEHSLDDGDVMLALDALATNPANPVLDSVLAQQVQFELRLLLSINKFTRQEVRQALRKIRKSVDRHNRIDGRRGYLVFIAKYVPC